VWDILDAANFYHFVSVCQGTNQLFFSAGQITMDIIGRKIWRSAELGVDYSAAAYVFIAFEYRISLNELNFYLRTRIYYP